MKQNKLIVAVHQDPTTRNKILKRLIVERGFALTPSDAEKLIKPSIGDIDLAHAYFVIADNYKFRESPITQQRFYEMAARGIAVILGTIKLQREFEFMCEAYYE
jgi:hypothetical protein